MALPPIYSRRKREAQASAPDVYTYDAIPNRVRVQVVQMLESGLGALRSKFHEVDELNPYYQHIVSAMRREKGGHHLADPWVDDPKHELITWLENETEIDRWLDGVEASLGLIDRHVRIQADSFYETSASPDEVIDEFNARLQEAAIGYQYVSGEIIRIDSQFVHSEVVLPVLQLLHDERFSSANDEYRSAHEAYRHGQLEDCLVDCCNALESVLKVIGRKRGWKFNDTDPASRLIQAAVDAGFLPVYSQTSLNHLKGLIETSTPTVRNKMAAHGAGENPRVIPRHLASFQLHQTAAVILYLAEQDSFLT